MKNYKYSSTKIFYFPKAFKYLLVRVTRDKWEGTQRIASKLQLNGRIEK